MMTSLRISILFILICSYILGQNTNQYDPKVNSVPTSPEVALLGRFGDIPVGHYTGTANVSIPLYNLKVDNIEIPLVLSYHTSGIKVADEATWVGLGWNFMPEGTITQEIRGREDSWVSGDGFSAASGYAVFKSNFPTLFSENQNYRLQVGYSDYISGGQVITNPSADDSFDVINRLKEKRGQPDIFTYNFYGYSGKFFFNPENHTEILFQESNNDVKFFRNSEGWVATTNKGDKFFFYAIEKSKTDQVTDYTDIGYTFKISKIELVSRKAIIFTYQDESTYQEYPTEVMHITNFTTSPNYIKSSNATINQKKTLIGIETDDTKIDFNLDNREDIRPYSLTAPIKKLASIDIRSKYPNRKIKSFLFNGTYFPTISFNTIEEGYKNKRLKLNSIQEVNYNEIGTPFQNTSPYTFEYDTSNTMPSKMSSSDFYGYHNGSNSTSLIPDLTYFDFANTPPFKNYNLNLSSGFVGTWRYTNPNYITTNILNKVIYPTGAHTEFEYESNTFSNQFIPNVGQLQSANKVLSLTHRGASTVPGGYYFLKSNRFKLPYGKIRFSNTIFDGYMGPNYPQTHYDWIQMATCRIEFHKVKTINGQEVDTMLKEWKVDVAGSVFEQTHQQFWDEEIIVTDNDPTIEYYVYVVNGIHYNSNDGSHRAVVSSDLRYYDDTGIDNSMSTGNGIRIKSIKNYQNSTLLTHKTYSYTGGKLIYPFKPLNLISGATYKDQPTFQSGGCFQEYISIFNDLSINSSDFGLGGNKIFGYDEVVEKDINVLDGTQKGFTKYKFTNNVPTGTVIKGAPKVDIPSNGDNILIEKYDQNQNKLFSKANIYDNLPNTYGIYPSFSIINTSTGSYDPNNNFYPYQLSGCGVTGISYTGDTYMNPLPTTKYNFIFTPLITGKRRLIHTIETSYFGNKSLVEKTDLNYNASGDLDISKTTTSDGKIFHTDYDYAYDLGNNRLLNKGMTGVPLSIEHKSGEIIATTLISHIETKYENPDNYLPSSMQSNNLQLSTWDTEVVYEKYDSKGNLLQYTTKDSVVTSIIWGYNSTQPIAKIVGIPYSVASLLAADMISASNADIDSSTEQTLIDKLDIFRNAVHLLPRRDSQVTTYTYDPLIGVTSITPPSGIREIYKYDSANRLESIKDVNGKIIKEFQYNYKH